MCSMNIFWKDLTEEAKQEIMNTLNYKDEEQVIKENFQGNQKDFIGRVNIKQVLENGRII